MCCGEAGEPGGIEISGISYFGYVLGGSVLLLLIENNHVPDFRFRQFGWLKRAEAQRLCTIYAQIVQQPVTTVVAQISTSNHNDLVHSYDTIDCMHLLVALRDLQWP